MTTLTAMGAKKPDNQEAAKAAEKDTLTMYVSMDCQNCEKKVGNVVRFEKGVTNMAIELDNQKVMVVYRPNKTDTAALCNKIRELGYVVTPWDKRP